jgi:hypothetical protein
LQELSDHEPDAQSLGIVDVREEQPVATFPLEDKPVPASSRWSIPKRPGRGTDKCPQCGADAFLSHPDIGVDV